MSGRLLSVAAVAELLSVSDDYVYDRIREGVFPVVELGSGRSKMRIREADVEAFVDSRTFGGVR